MWPDAKNIMIGTGLASLWLDTTAVNLMAFQKNTVRAPHCPAGNMKALSKSS